MYIAAMGVLLANSINQERIFLLILALIERKICIKCIRLLRILA
jgi:hypothetical protein